MYLATLPPLVAHAITRGEPESPHALPMRAPALAIFDLGDGYATFRSRVAVGDGEAGAEFLVLADGRRLAAERVGAGEAPRDVVVPIRGARMLELAVNGDAVEAVWLDPEVEAVVEAPRALTDCFGHFEIDPVAVPPTSRCIATVATGANVAAVDDLLGSVVANGGCPDAALVVFGIGAGEAVAAKYNAAFVPCRAIHETASPRSLLYSVARVVHTAHILCLDAECLVTASLEPIFAALEALPPHTVLVSPAGDAIFAGSRAALLGLDSTIRVSENISFDLALARLNAAVQLDDTWHVAEGALFDESTRRVAATWRGRPARIIHGNNHAHLRGRYAAVERPLVGPYAGDSYARFLAALRAWGGIYGRDGMQWTFYATPGDNSGHVRDTSVMPVLAVLHYLIRANGAVRVLETGTARGVSTACIASAVMHRDGGRVVTFDPFTYDGRDEMWGALPAEMRACIEPRMIGSTEGMRAALAAGERFDAALLDSLHHTDYVVEEFDLARQLVCPGGMILVHDALMRDNAVEEALRRIERQGYGVARLFAAECGVHEEDGLGLAIIENRSRAEWRA